ncbi:alpha/beta hydrolase family protein [Usitatibacter palustris]|uniref:Xaa-Pro dipeptidyl-peptidase-like domain-containing protein n=1 Tax=Usitatibacter palustris TaxID=2732487 RepID=A0A6M4HAL4_9PROT|nr:alpha/beta fold hydrolase [Usitatibacter palustris]QJR16272.1 hypothetical protein DSM104440_03101 [Usitatibacter palustris]
MLRGLVAIASAAAVLSAAAALPDAREPPIEKVLRASVPATWGRPDEIEVTLYQPPGPGPFPVAVLSHGSPRNPDDRRRGGRVRLQAQSRAFVAMGFAVLVPTRRGYGDSGGDWAEGYGSCRGPDYYNAGLETVRDITASLAAVRGNPALDAKRVVLVGQSAGGWGSIAASSQPIEGLVAVVNFAGGRGSQAPGSVCVEENLVDAVARYGKTSRVPQLWIYSENDLYFGPALVRRMHGAFTAAGGRAQLMQMPPFGRDGHLYFGNVANWAEPVEKFLRTTTHGQ